MELVLTEYFFLFLCLLASHQHLHGGARQLEAVCLYQYVFALNIQTFSGRQV